MLSGQMESAARAQERRHQQYRDRDLGQLQQQMQETTRAQAPTLRRSSTSISESVRGSPRMARRSLGNPVSPSLLPRPQPSPSPPLPPPENARQVSGKKGLIELVEQRVLEDTPARTISLWRERVAQSSVNGDLVDGATGTNNPDAQSEANSHARVYANRRRGSDAVQGLDRGHRRMPSGSHHLDPRIRRVVSEHAGHGSSLGGSGTRNGSVRDSEVRAGKHNRATYERSEVSVTSKIVALVYG